MAIISKSQQVYSNGTKSYWTVNSELDTSTGKVTATILSGRGSVVDEGPPSEVTKTLANNPAFSREPDFFNGLISAVNNQNESLVASNNQLNPPPATEPVPPATEAANNPNNLGATSASDDNSYDRVEAARLNSGKANSDTATNNENTTTSTLTRSFAGQTVAGTAATGTGTNSTVPESDPTDKPGKRNFNPLSQYSSYTYQISLYMITPDAYQAFIESGRKNINALVAADSSRNVVQGTGGAYIVAQSGGIGTSTPRAPGLEFDYYIDNLKIVSKPAGPSTTAASSETDISFTIYEPYGFSLVSKLQKAGETLRETSKLKNKNDLNNFTRTFYILGIRFLGYDEKGNLITEKSNTNGATQFDAGGSFERFYDIFIKKMTFKLDGKVSTYNFTAASVAPLTSFGNIRGRINKDSRLIADTVFDALKGPQGLFTQLNKQQEMLKRQNGPDGKPSIGEENVYDVEFLGSSDDIRNAPMITDADKKNKSLWPMSIAAKTQQVNDSLSITSTPDNSKRIITFVKNTSVIQAISSIISQSRYLTDALKTAYGNELDGMADVSNQENKPKPSKPIKWYSLTSEVIPKAYDPIVGDYAYKITYYIQPYETPYVTSPYVSATQRYQGPYKRYDYWFTGKNSEIINFEQEFDNSFYLASVSPSGSRTSQSGSAATPVIPNTRQNEDRTGATNVGKEAENSYLTSLFSPSSWAKSKITIMGDPDYLIQDTPNTINTVYKQFYGTDGFTINGNGGQVFIEIDFKEAVDYSTDNGLMNINESILFLKYPPAVKKVIKGVAFQVIEIESRFSGGKFTQVLTSRPTPFDTNAVSPAATASSTSSATTTGDLARADRTATNNRESSSTNNVVASNNPNTTTLGSGFTADPWVPPVDTTGGVNSDNISPPSTVTQVTAPTGGGSGVAEGVAGTITEPGVTNPVDTVRTATQSFTATVTAADAATAEQLALAAAQTQATSQFGNGIQYESFNEVRVKENSDPRLGVQSYTATYTVRASGVEGTVSVGPTPVVNRNVANDDAGSSIPVSAKALIQGADGGRENNNLDQLFRSGI